MKPQIDIVRCFIEHPDYFQGAGADIFVGMGDTALSALDDAIELCASDGQDSEGKDLPDDIEWPGRTDQEAILREAGCNLDYALSEDPDYAGNGEDYNDASIYLLIKVYV